MNSLERELESSSENEGLRKKQVKLDDQLMEVLSNQCSLWAFIIILRNLFHFKVTYGCVATEQTN